MVSRRVSNIEYAIRDIAVIANEVKKKGKTVYNLNIGDPVKYDFKTPKFISEALAKVSTEGNNFYADSMGVVELREEISKDLNTNTPWILTRQVQVTIQPVAKVSSSSMAYHVSTSKSR